MAPNTTTTHELDDLTPHQLIDEIKQIAEQYGREVTSARRTWPKSVRDRVLALARLGVPRGRIGKECGIPVATIFLWCKQIPGRRPRSPSVLEPAVSRQSRFLELPVSDICKSNPIPTAGLDLQILLPGGIEVRGLSSIDQILALYRGCRE